MTEKEQNKKQKQVNESNKRLLKFLSKDQQHLHEVFKSVFKVLTDEGIPCVIFPYLPQYIEEQEKIKRVVFQYNNVKECLGLKYQKDGKNLTEKSANRVFLFNSRLAKMIANYFNPRGMLPQDRQIGVNQITNFCVANEAFKGNRKKFLEWQKNSLSQNTGLTGVQKASKKLFKRYKKAFKSLKKKNKETKHLIWMCKTADKNIKTWSIDKTSRWLGFIQCSAINNKKLNMTIESERDFSRPLFHEAYNIDGIMIPKTEKDEKNS